MQVIKAPSKDLIWCSRSVFLAGGITNCPDWQKEFLSYFKSDAPICFFNPRRDDFDVNNKNLTPQQIRWEHNALQRAEIIIFWFPKETLCPITLFELGKSLMKNKKILIGCHPDYARKLDVKIQTNLEGKFTIYSSVKSLTNALKKYLQ